MTKGYDGERDVAFRQRRGVVTVRFYSMSRSVGGVRGDPKHGTLAAEAHRTQHVPARVWA